MGLFSGKKGLDAGRRQRLQHRLGDQSETAGGRGGDRLHPPPRRQDGAGAFANSRIRSARSSSPVRRPEKMRMSPGSSRKARQTYGALDFVLHSIAFAPIDDIKCNYVNASREGFKTAMEISVYSLAIAGPARGRVDAQRRFDRHPDLARGERVVSGYNLMGVCKARRSDASVRYLAMTWDRRTFE